MKYIDIHAHLNFKDFDSDREEVIKRIKKNDMAVINIGTDLKTSGEVIKLTEHENMYATVGLHPVYSVENVEESINALRELAKNEKVVGIGECGLDYFRMEGDSRTYKEKQQKLFRKQIELALELDLPLMIHCRDAYYDLVNILKEYKGEKLRGDVHFFAGDIDIAKELLDLNFDISFTGVITFASPYEELVKYVPLDRMHAETDSPYVAPKPFRGKRNEPLYTLEVIRKIAEIKEVSIKEVERQLVSNAERLFNI